MSQFLEVCMLVAFGFAWPTNIINAWKNATAVGMSLSFFVIVEIGYLCGIFSKIISGNITYVLIFYIINFIMVLTNIVIYFRNRKLDKVNNSD